MPFTRFLNTDTNTEGDIILDNKPYQPISPHPIPGWVYPGAVFMILMGGWGIWEYPHQFPAVIGGIFILGGIAVIVGGTRRLLLKRQRDRRPDQPWMFEFDPCWRVKGSKDRFETTWVQPSCLVLIVGLGIAVLAYLAVVEREFVLPVVVSAWGIIGVIAWILLPQNDSRKINLNPFKFGRSFLSFDRFPFFLGGTFDAVFHAPKAIGLFSNVSFTLRCVDDNWEAIEFEEDGKHVYKFDAVSRQIFSSQVRIDNIHPQSDAMDGYALSFPLPEGDYGTDVTQYPARYWQLVVEADTVKGPYKRVFRVPVYERPA